MLHTRPTCDDALVAFRQPKPDRRPPTLSLPNSAARILLAQESRRTTGASAGERRRIHRSQNRLPAAGSSAHGRTRRKHNANGSGTTLLSSGESIRGAVGGRRSRASAGKDQSARGVPGTVEEAAEWVVVNRRSSLIIGVANGRPTGGGGERGAVSTPPRDRRPRPPMANDVKR